MQAFNEVMVTGSVSEAARNLHRSQPSVSALIASLEDELGVRLFERRKGRLHPVPEARYLQQECAEILARIDGVRQNLSRLKSLELGELHVVSMPGPSVFLLPALVAELARERPETRTSLISRSSEAVVQLVAAQRHDVGLADLEVVERAESPLVHVEAFDHACACAVPADHPLAARRRIGPEDLAGEPMAALYPEHATRRATEAVMRAVVPEWRPRFTAQYFLPLLSWVERGLACAVVDAMSAESYRLYRDVPRVVFVPFEPAIEHRVALLTPAHRPASMLSEAFAGALRAELERLSCTVRPRRAATADHRDTGRGADRSADQGTA